jgi:hypothetical protein
MSLLATASPWINSTAVQSKKRIPTIKRKQSQETFVSPPPTTATANTPTGSSYFPWEQGTGNEKEEELKEKEQIINPTTHEETQKKVIKHIENMSNMNISSEGDSLFNYRPSTYTLENDTRINPSVPIFQRQTENSPFQTDKSNLDKLVNYSNAYEIPKDTRPYYAKHMGINNTDSFEEKMLDKIQYLTHLVEEMQNEKTANITEEYILYSMLGVFIIYVVDVFSKNGKYVR